jgi:hypothetical protein
VLLWPLHRGRGEAAKATEAACASSLCHTTPHQHAAPISARRKTSGGGEEKSREAREGGWGGGAPGEPHRPVRDVGCVTSQAKPKSAICRCGPHQPVRPASVGVGRISAVPTARMMRCTMATRTDASGVQHSRRPDCNAQRATLTQHAQRASLQPREWTHFKHRGSPCLQRLSARPARPKRTAEHRAHAFLARRALGRR